MKISDFTAQRNYLGNKEGFSIQYWESKKIVNSTRIAALGHFKNGIRIGWWVTFYSTGEIMDIVLYENGKRIYVKGYYCDGHNHRITYYIQ